MTGAQAKVAEAIKAEWRDLQARYSELVTVKLVFNGRLKSRLGQCKFRRVHGPAGYSGWRAVQVEVAKFVLNDPAKAMDTFLHEVAHALAGREANHGPKWKRWCVTIGAEPSRCGTVAPEHKPEAKYTGTCDDCGYEYRRHRKSKAMGKGYRCAKCKGWLTWRDRRGRVVSHSKPEPTPRQEIDRLFGW